MKTTSHITIFLVFQFYLAAPTIMHGQIAKSFVNVHAPHRDDYTLEM